MTYYGLISGLPDLKPLQQPELDIHELRSLLHQYAQGQDALILHHFFFQLDLINYNAIIQKKPMWMDGGNIDKDTLEKWVHSGEIQDTPFQYLELHHAFENSTPTEHLQDYWQHFYDEWLRLAGENLHRLINFEISLKNFYKGYLERKIHHAASVHYLTGGWFDRFAYRKLLIGDIQAEHPHLAAVLACFETADPLEREQKILETKWRFYDYESFFSAFELPKLVTWLLKYLDLYKWQQNNKEQGLENIREFTDVLNTQIEAHY
jgi:hypothetical protein